MVGLRTRRCRVGLENVGPNVRFGGERSNGSVGGVTVVGLHDGAELVLGARFESVDVLTERSGILEQAGLRGVHEVARPPPLEGDLAPVGAVEVLERSVQRR
ncbi:hypothetical protein ACFQMM_08550 [Saliphagus sp. GCM10025308]